MQVDRQRVTSFSSRRTLFIRSMFFLLCLLLLPGCGREEAHPHRLLNVSYDPTRELYQEYNKAFVEMCRAEGLADVRIEQSHGGSGRQSRAVMDGLDADVVTLALGYDIDVLAHYGHLLSEDWAGRLPNNSTPYYSTIAFLVRRGNPKGIRDWGDLVKGDVEVIMPNPKTSGGARWIYLAAWAWCMRQNGGSEAKTVEYLVKLFKHVPVLGSGARGASNTFSQQGKGDVLVGWENEALMLQSGLGKEGLEIVYPTLSIKAEPPVAVVDLSVDLHGNRELAEKYVNYLYSPVGQEIVARHFYRPWQRTGVAPETLAVFKQVAMVDIHEFGGWLAAHATHFANGGTFETVWKQLYLSNEKFGK